MSVLEAALEYATKYGFSVLPLHGVFDSRCTCGHEDCASPGKHPWTKHGLKDASSDPDVIAAMFAHKAAANVGIATGPVSNLFVIDVDGPTGEASLSKFPPLPETLTSTTGRGRHLFFRYPKGQKVYTRSSKFAAGLDVRGEGGYIVAPTSTHISGVKYQFLDENAPIADAPQWVIDNACKPPEERATVIEYQDSVRSGQEWTLDQVRDMLTYLNPDCGYDEWIQVGMALHSGGYSLAVWDEWSKRGAKYKAGCTIPHWKSFKHNAGISFGTFVHMAQREGWRPEDDEPISLDDHPAREFLLRVKAGNIPTKKKTDSKALFDPLKLPGLIGDTVREIVETAQKPQPELALMNVLAALGAVYGRRYRSPMNTRTNIYFVGIAPTASGKDHSRRYVKQLMYEADLDCFLGDDQIISGQGLLQAVSLKPAQVMHIDEFGMVLESMMDVGGAHYMRVASKVITELYSTSSGTYLGGTYADKKAEKIRIPYPNLCIYATTTPDKYAENLSRDAVASGELNRFIVLRTKVDMPERRRFTGEDRASEHILSGWANLYPGTKVNTGVMVPETITVSWTGLDDRIWDMGLFEDKKIVSNRTSGALWGRYRENCIKIAMIMAITRNTLVPVINSDDLDVAEAIVQQAIEYTVGLVETQLYETQHEKDCNDILKSLAEAGGELTIMKINNKLKRLTSKQRNEVIDSLLDQGLIKVGQKETGGMGRPSKYVRLV